MNRILRYPFSGLLALLLCMATNRHVLADAAPFKSDDVVCWIGDSITHFGTYPEQIQLFYETRFPDRSIAYFNCGSNGDAASPIVDKRAFRIDRDILAHKPTVATIMLGMNDIGRSFYEPHTTLHDPEGNKRSRLESYDQKMQMLIQILQKAGVRVILLTPSPYDDTMVQPNDRQPIAVGANDALRQCTAKMRQWAEQYHCDLVDFHDRMTAINAEHQKADPSFTIVSKDRIHPGPVGNLVMAYAFLKDSGLTACVSQTTIDAATATATSSENCTITKIQAAPGQSVSFESLEKALPFPVTAKAKPALDLVPFTQDLNQETLAITHLPPAHWRVSIDAAAVGDFDQQQLAAGINLATLPVTPQYQQAEKVMQDLEALNALVVMDRRVFTDFYGHYGQWKFDPDTDRPQAVQAINQLIDQARKDNTLKWHDEWTTFVDDKAQAAHVKQEQDLLSRIDKNKAPTPHRYVIARLKPGE